jgi:hypothetical protein
MSGEPAATETRWRREWDSNPRGAAPQHALQACALDRSAIPPSARDHTQARFSRQRSRAPSSAYGQHRAANKASSVMALRSGARTRQIQPRPVAWRAGALRGCLGCPASSFPPGGPGQRAGVPRRNCPILGLRSAQGGNPAERFWVGDLRTAPAVGAWRTAGAARLSLPAPGPAWSAPGRPWAGTAAARRSCSWPRCARPRSPPTT